MHIVIYLLYLYFAQLEIVLEEVLQLLFKKIELKNKTKNNKKKQHTGILNNF